MSDPNDPMVRDGGPVAVCHGEGLPERKVKNRKPRWRKALRAALKAQGMPEAYRQTVMCVDTTMLVPQWARDVAVAASGELPHRVWLRKDDAFKLINLDKMCGGRPRFTECEYRRCSICFRPLVGEEAINRRELDSLGDEGRKQPCGQQCYRDAAIRVWKKLGGN